MGGLRIIGAVDRLAEEFLLRNEAWEAAP